MFNRFEFWFSKYPDGFFKFLAPTPEHPLYKEGDSWTEELAFSVEEVRNAFAQIGMRFRSKKAFEDALDKFRDPDQVDSEEFLYCCYQDRQQRVTYFLRNHERVDALLDELAQMPSQKLGLPVSRKSGLPVSEKPGESVSEKPALPASGDGESPRPETGKANLHVKEHNRHHEKTNKRVPVFSVTDKLEILIAEECSLNPANLTKGQREEIEKAALWLHQEYDKDLEQKYPDAEKRLGILQSHVKKFGNWHREVEWKGRSPQPKWVREKWEKFRKWIRNGKK
jgi:hypothetical protein